MLQHFTFLILCLSSGAGLPGALGRKGPSPPPLPPEPQGPYERRGFRLVSSGGAYGPAGRLEVRARRDSGSDEWLPVLDSALDARTATEVCKAMGLKFGRKYYAPGLNTPDRFAAVGSLSCRRIKAGDGSGRRLRSLLQWLPRDDFNAVIPAAAGYKCSGQTVFSYRVPAEPFAALMCSATKLPRAPSPPPPLPPSLPPPPSPPNYSDQVRMYRAVGSDDPATEPNLCPNRTAACSGGGRVEVLVTDPRDASRSVWAPLCDVANKTEWDYLPTLICRQSTYWLGPRGSYIDYRGSWAAEPLAIPTGAVSGPGLFDPAAYPAWASLPRRVPGGNLAARQRVQDAGLRASASRCPGGARAAIRCTLTVV